MNKWIKSLVIIMLIPTKVIGSSQNELAKVSELLSVGQVNKAKLVLTHIERNDSNRLERQLLQIQIKFAESHFELVEEQLSTLIEQYPEDARLYIWYGRVSSVLARQASVFSAPGYAKACRRAFKKAVELASTSVEGHKRIFASRSANRSTVKSVGKLPLVLPLPTNQSARSCKANSTYS